MHNLDNKFINILLIGGSAGSLELNKFLTNKLLKIDRTLIKKFQILYPSSKKVILRKFLDKYEKFEN